MDADEKRERKIELLRKLRNSLREFSKTCLKVRAKNKKIIPFVLNRAQTYVHEKIEEQLRETGRVRALILKGRQQGISTYVAARFYHKASMWSGVMVYILAHEQPASDNLFKIVERYQEYNPLQPRTGMANAKVLEFDRLGSIYKVATAGQKAGGRSGTGSLFHGSEAAFWANAADHFAASVQTVPEEEGTEVLLETTGNGPVGEFYERWQEAEGGESDYLAIFVPWFWQEEYSRETSSDFELQESSDPEIISEIAYAEMFKLTDGQMRWRRAKIQALRSVDLFNQEYPATAQMAFVSSGEGSYISALPVLRARKREVEGGGPLIIGADPAGPGGDRFAIAGRRGHNIEFLKWRNKLTTSEAYHWCKQIILDLEPARVNIDAGGIGAAILRLLRKEEYIPKVVVRGINFGARSQAKQARPSRPGPRNRRAEMWMRLKEWLMGEEPVSIPDIDVLQADLTGPQLKPNLTNDIQLESKEQMRLRRVRSPDLADALALTFASASIITNYVDRKLPKRFGEPDKVKEESVARKAIGGVDGWMG